MRKLTYIIFCLFTLSASAQGIVDVLHSSELKKLEQLRAAPPTAAKAQVLNDTYNKILSTVSVGDKNEFVVVRQSAQLITLNGSFVVVSDDFADYPEAERVFMIAHELGHVIARDFDQLAAVYLKYIPGEVVPEKTDPVAEPLGREASKLKYKMEFNADYFAYKTAIKMGFRPEDILGFFMDHPEIRTIRDTATHPGTMRRHSALLERLNSEGIEVAEASTKP